MFRMGVWATVVVEGEDLLGVATRQRRGAPQA
jgi:hypothetical protein